MNKRLKFKHHVISFLFRFFLRSRYKIEFINDNIIKDIEPKIFLPNHPALIDPIILTSFIYKYNPIAPVISAKYYRNGLFSPILNLIKAIPVADLSEGERDVNVYEKFAKSAAERLKEGHHVLLYPGGQLSSQKEEKLHNKQGAFRLVKELPEGIKIIAVRSTGLWGSRWSRAKTGKTPDFINVFFNSLKRLALHAFFFMPKRKVVFEFKDLTEELRSLSMTDRKTFNTFLEKYYNAE